MAIYDLSTRIPSPSELKVGDILNIPFTGASLAFNLPQGKFKFECWGAQGGHAKGCTTGGSPGGFSTGIITLKRLTQLFANVGGQVSGESLGVGGFNGGGANHSASTNSWTGGPGGGGTDIRIAQNSLYARVIVAGGGAGGCAWKNSTSTPSGVGGGLTGGTASTSGGARQATGGTQTGGGIYGYWANDVILSDETISHLNGTFGQGGELRQDRTGNFEGAGGGGGWYGGGYGSYVSAGGGSGYIYNEANAANYPEGCLLNPEYYLENGVTHAGNVNFLNPNGVIESGHIGNGYCRVTVIELATATMNTFNENGQLVTSQKSFASTPNGWKEISRIFAMHNNQWKRAK